MILSRKIQEFILRKLEASLSQDNKENQKQDNLSKLSPASREILENFSMTGEEINKAFAKARKQFESV